MTEAEKRKIRKYLDEVMRKQYDFSIDAATRKGDLAKLGEVITEVMVASAESEKGTEWIMLNHLENKARSCRKIILMLIEKLG